MKSLVRPSFWRAHAGLDDRARQAARRAYAQFARDPGQPSLRFKKLGGYDHIWSVRVNEQYRAVGEIGSARRAKENSPAIYRWVWADEGVRVPEGRQKSCPPCAQAQRGFFRPCGTTARHPAAPAFPWWAAQARLYSTEISEEPASR